MTSQSGAGRGLVALLAVTCGAAAANTYYAQPLLHTLARTFAVSAGTAGLLVTVSQLGFLLGLAFLVPLGDLHERRRLITLMLLVAAAALVLAGVAPGFAVFAGAVGLIGLSSVAAQVIVPMSSSLAAEHERGRVVGTVMSGLLVGILAARTVSGLLAAALGWRAVYFVAAGAMVVLAGVLRRVLPAVPPTDALSYRRLLGSVLRLVAEEPVLRRRMLLGAASFGAFSALWTTLAFLLSGAPYGYGNAVIGLFGLAGVGGALAASLAGRVADRGHGALATTLTTAIMLGAWALVALGRTSLAALIAGIVAVDFGSQGMHVSNQSAIYALRGEARSRLTTAYMVSFFLGGAAASAAASFAWAAGGWDVVCALGAGISALALASWGLFWLLDRGRREPVGGPWPAPPTD